MDAIAFQARSLLGVLGVTADAKEPQRGRNIAVHRCSPKIRLVGQRVVASFLADATRHHGHVGAGQRRMQPDPLGHHRPTMRCFGQHRSSLLRQAHIAQLGEEPLRELRNMDPAESRHVRPKVTKRYAVEVG